MKYWKATVSNKCLKNILPWRETFFCSYWCLSDVYLSWSTTVGQSLSETNNFIGLHPPPLPPFLSLYSSSNLSTFLHCLYPKIMNLSRGFDWCKNNLAHWELGVKCRNYVYCFVEIQEEQKWTDLNLVWITGMFNVFRKV